ncbi:unnamed protein product [Sphagnum balticum]
MMAEAADYCAIDMRPFESLSGLGFKALIQTALDIGSSSTGRVTIDELLANSTTATLALEKFKHPILHKVVWWRHVIMGHLRLVLSDVVDEDGNMTTAKNSDSIKAIKGIMLPLLKKMRSSVSMYDQMFDDDDEEDNVPPAKGHDAVAAFNARVDNEYEAYMKHKVTDGEMR